MKFMGLWTVHRNTVHRRPVKSCGYCSCTVHEQCRLLGERRKKKKKKKEKTQQTQRGSKLSLCVSMHLVVVPVNSILITLTPHLVE